VKEPSSVKLLSALQKANKPDNLGELERIFATGGHRKSEKTKKSY